MRLRCLAAFLFIIALPPAGIAAQDAAEPVADEAAAGLSALASIEANEPLSFYGLIESAAGAALGWPRGPRQPDFWEGTAATGGFSIVNTLGFDARPSSAFRVHGSVTVSSPTYSLAVNELFLDYSLADAIFLRGGKQTISWDNTRIFVVGDLIDSLPAALSLKAYVPFGGSGLSFVATADAGAVGGDFSAATTAYAAKADFAFGRFELAEAATYAEGGAITFASTIKTSLAGMDLFAEGFGDWHVGGNARFSFVGGAFWESADPRVKAYGEYWYNGAAASPDDHRLALGLAWTVDESWGFKAALLWAHAFADGSGAVMPGLSIVPAEHVTISLATPFSYGESGETYTFAMPPGVTMPFAWVEKYSAVLKVDISLAY